ncbi:MAG: TSUP family transporter [Oscillospiraceae bacterium]|jgi:uncharacterized membrane protein YfcA|nr:TSUP family transporter [Oscillospiraceae bacterium]
MKNTKKTEPTAKQVKIRYAVAGVLAGAANGFFGSGGGMFIIPLFAGWAKLDEKKTFASSVAVVLPLCAASALIYTLRGGIDFGQALPYLIGGAAGGIVGGKVFKKIPAKLLKKAFALLLIYGGIRSLLK